MAPPHTLHLTQHVQPLFDAFHQAGFQLFLVGGSVRDALMGKAAGFDYDCATDALPADTERLLRKLRLTVYTVGARFGTIAAVWPTPDDPKNIVEITTFRHAEAYEPDSRKPIVTFGATLDGDLGRRDLSINAMAVDQHGRLVDPFNGLNAIHNRVLEVPGGGLENTVSILTDDPLRILRVARFAARLGFAPTADLTRAATTTAARLQSISHERWKAELDKTLDCHHVDHAMRWLLQTGALAQLFPALGALTLADPSFAWLSHALNTIPASQRSARWAALACADFFCSHPDTSPDLVLDALRATAPTLVQNLAERFRLSRDEATAMERMLLLAPLNGFARAWSDADIRHHWDQSGTDTAGRLWLASSLLTDPDHVRTCHVNRERAIELAARVDLRPHLPKGLGLHIQRAFDYRGPGLGRAMQALHVAALDGGLPLSPSTDECLAWLRTNPLHD